MKPTAFTVLGLAALALSAHAQTYPSKPVTLVVPFAPGGSVDVAGRMIAEPLSKTLGQPFVVENRPGAAGNIGHAVVAQAPKDGHTVLVAYSTTVACSPALFPKLTWDSVRDFTPVGMLGVQPLVIAVPDTLPVKTLGEFIAHAKQNPGALNYGSSGVGSQAHISAEMLAQKTGVNMVHVPFKGSGDLMPSLISGRIHMAMVTTSALKPHLGTGRLRAIAVTTMARDASLPDVPTVNESGVPGYEVEGWIGLFVPAGTPAPAVNALADALRQATESSDFRQRGLNAGLPIRHLRPDALAAKVRKELDECSAAVKAAGIKLE